MQKQPWWAEAGVSSILVGVPVTWRSKAWRSHSTWDHTCHPKRFDESGIRTTTPHDELRRSNEQGETHHTSAQARALGRGRKRAAAEAGRARRGEAAAKRRSQRHGRQGCAHAAASPTAEGARVPARESEIRLHADGLHSALQREGKSGKGERGCLQMCQGMCGGGGSLGAFLREYLEARRHSAGFSPHRCSALVRFQHQPKSASRSQPPRTQRDRAHGPAVDRASARVPRRRGCVARARRDSLRAVRGRAA